MLKTHLPSSPPQLSTVPCMEVFVQFEHTQFQMTQEGTVFGLICMSFELFLIA